MSDLRVASCWTGINKGVFVREGKESAGFGMESFGITFTGDTGEVESGGKDGMAGFVESCEKVLNEYKKKK